MGAPHRKPVAAKRRLYYGYLGAEHISEVLAFPIVNVKGKEFFV